MKIIKREDLPVEQTGVHRVFVPSLPTRWDGIAEQRSAVYDLSPAKIYGTLFSLSIDVQEAQEALTAIANGMADFSENDYILAIGDVTRIVAAVLAAKEKLSSAKLLQWDKRSQQYLITEVIF